MQDRISLHHIAFPTNDIRALGAHFAATGVRRVTLWSGLFEENGLPAVQEMLAEHGYGVETVPHVFRPGFLSRDAGEDRDRLSRAIGHAKAVGANSIYMLTGGRGAMEWAEAADVFAEAVAPCAAEARAAGVALSIETTVPFYVDLHLGTSLRDAVRLVELADIGLTLDYFGVWTEADVAELVVRAIPRTVLVQVGDYVYGDRFVPGRAVPGDGVIDWRKLIRLMVANGYTGNFDLELVGPRIAEEGPEIAGKRAVEALTSILEDCGV
jgi:sugar phosphate isomerase/epimerase